MTHLKARDRIVCLPRGGEPARHGIFHGLVKHTCRWDGDQTALVTFDGRERYSRVAAWRLEKEKK